ncbi:MAG: hypothetical protein M3Y41_14735 [Pseudomonadota bacterium]|nr:hypothetical protein [Pseudomonadota bacterium]
MTRAVPLVLLLLAGCAQPIGSDGRAVSFEVAVCETLPGVHCCRAAERPAPPAPYCTRSLGVADCWRDPSLLPDHPPELADSQLPLSPSAEQVACLQPVPVVATAAPPVPAVVYATPVEPLSPPAVVYAMPLQPPPLPQAEGH